MSGKNSKALLLITLMLCITLAVYYSAAMLANAQQPTYTSGSCQNASGSGVLPYQREMGPSDVNVTLFNRYAIRTIYIGDYGLVTVNDTLLVANNGTATASSWIFYLAADVYPNLRYLAAYGNGTNLNVIGAPSFSSLVGMKVDFTSIGGLPINSSLLVTLIQQFSGLVSLEPGSQYVGLLFYKYVISPYSTASYNITVSLPSGAQTLEPVNMTAGTVNSFNCTRLGSFSNGKYDYIFSGGPLIEVSVIRRAEITVDGYIYTTETHRVRNIGPANLTSIHFLVPLSILPDSLTVGDSSGKLSSGNNGLIVSASFRYGVAPNWTYTYYVSYKTALDDYRVSQNGLSVLRLQPVTGYNGSATFEQFSLVLPPHAQLISTNQSFENAGIQDNKIVVTYTFRNVTFLNVGSIEFKYIEDIAQVFQRPILISFGVFAVGFIYIVTRKLFPRTVPVSIAREEEVKARGLTATLKEFSSNYEEKTALTLEMEKLMEDRRKGRISKRAYLEQIEHNRRRIASLTNGINEAKKKLVPANRRYATLIRQLETYEEERENARASLENLELRRRQGKVSGDVYNRLKYENTRKIEKATSGIDSIVVQLRQETL